MSLIFLYSDAITKSASFIKEIHRKVKETVTTVPHQEDGYAKIPADTNLKQGAVLPLGPSRDFNSLIGRVNGPAQP